MRKYVFIFFIGILLIPLLFVVLDIVNITNHISLTREYDWLGFYGGFLGSTLGGIATFLGVYLTLQHQKKVEDEKNRLSVIPILEYKISYNKTDFDNSNGQLAGEVWSHINIGEATYEDKDSLEWYFNLIISNIGLGHAQITGINFKFVASEDHNVVIQEQQIGFSYILVKKEHDKSFKAMIYAPGKDVNELTYGLKIIVQYQDLFGNEYEQLIHAAIASSNGINFADLSYYENFKLINNKF
ncbi:hypothetical protein J7E38_13380 [Bacillus sp. ISL-35]|uniref:hypothetical protein n=1 Tax=Bacillus sp. ISL-35 TaxID=2819122 RepID=UPI001BECDB8A|nr:hypothetical protein [Bacillus sp. ISL-35]MBT2680000.1 hypothetical protein [Bacillus sp. ISL-35]MBT2703024.1 hypothetical protein [Chryseobacterium sp. ISL-80]